MSQAEWLPRVRASARVARPGDPPPPTAGRDPQRSWLWLGVGLPAALVLVAGSALELQSSALQASLFSQLARAAAFELGAGPAPGLAPPSGPFDQRAGYPLLPRHVERLEALGYRVTAQARPSAPLERVVRLGLFPPYAEKTQLGLRILGRDGAPLYSFLRPTHVYPDFEGVPPVVVATLLFVENRELLDHATSRRNPAVEWDRLGRAALWRLGGLRGPGGSTLATQLEKFRHSPGGVTGSPLEKLRQMISASLRSYRDGPQTLDARRRIVVDYLNTMPLAAAPGGEEVFGLADGLARWYGADPEQASRRLAALPGRGDADPDVARDYARVLSLLLAARRPTDLLARDPERLREHARRYLDRLELHGVVSPALRDAARAAVDGLRPGEIAHDAPGPAAARRDVAPVRGRLAALLASDGFYALDRLDLSVVSSLDARAQRLAGQRVETLRRPEAAAEAGLVGLRLLDRGREDGVTFSLNVYERGADAHRLRVQVGNDGGALELSDGGMLDFGSTAKLRTLVSYLEAVAALHARWSASPPAERAAWSPTESDRLGRWALAELRARPDLTLPALLDAALERRYSASPAARFFTGGAPHRFHNFDGDDDGRVVSVREAFRRSVNLPFVRLLRDVVDHIAATRLDADAVLAAPDGDGRRLDYLLRFVESDARERLERAYSRAAGLAPAEALARFYGARRPSPRAAAVALRAVEPAAGPEQLARELAVLRPGAPPPEDPAALHAAADPARLSLHDQGYLSRLHPLELWLVARLVERPDATFAELVDASREVRGEAYRWLFHTRSRRARDRRVATLLEREAFAHLHAEWRATGYPFASLVPSLATALGSSADRPGALAELMGILASDGVRVPLRRVDELRFAADTPYETRLAPAPAAPERVLRPEVCAAVREALVDTVERGTAVRARGVLRRADGSPAAVGGKTGTGDHRYKVVRDGRVVAERPVSRSAAFAFVIDERWFGVVTAVVTGEESARHQFTSSLPVQLFKVLMPEVLPLLEADAARETAAEAPAADQAPSSTTSGGGAPQPKRSASRITTKWTTGITTSVNTVEKSSPATTATPIA